MTSQTRCPRKIGEICETVEPELEEAEPGWFKRCHIPAEELRDMQLAQKVWRVFSKRLHGAQANHLARS